MGAVVSASPLLSSGGGNLHVLLSSSVPLILPLIRHCPRIGPKVQTREPTDSGQQSRGHQSMKWKKKTNPSDRTLGGSGAAPDTADKVVDQATQGGQWSRQCCAVRGKKILPHTQTHAVAWIRQQNTAGARKTNYTDAGSAGLHSG